jgi:hypothetical protein
MFPRFRLLAGDRLQAENVPCEVQPASPRALLAISRYPDPQPRFNRMNRRKFVASVC